MPYIVPHLEIKQEFTQIPILASSPLSALVIGPQYKPFSYQTDKAETALVRSDTGTNLYSGALYAGYALPDAATVANVDNTSFELYMDDAVALYYNPASVTIAVDENVVTVTEVLFKAAGNKVNNLDPEGNELSRDAQIGDSVVFTGADNYSLITTIADIVYSDGDITTTVGTWNTPSRGAISMALGATSGLTPAAETVFTITVSADNGTRPTELKVSNSLNSTVLTQTISATGVTAVPLNSVASPNTFIVSITITSALTGDYGKVNVSAAGVITKPAFVRVGDITLTTAGDYTGTKTINYQVVITQATGNVPTQFKVLSDDVDSSGPFTITAGGKVEDFALGTLGLTGTLSSAASPVAIKALVGDFVNVTVTNTIPNTYNKLVLEDVPVGASLVLKGLGVKLSDVNIPQYTDISTAPSSSTWSVDSAGAITITAKLSTTTATPANAKVFTTVPSITDEAGAVVALPIISANTYIAWREWVTTNVGTISSVKYASQVAALLGPTTPENPLAQGVYNAALNSNGAEVYYTAVATDDVAGYNTALTLSNRNNNYYSIVPLTFDKAVQDAVKAHVLAMSDPKQTRITKWRIAWFSVPMEDTATIVDLQSDDTAWKCTVVSDGDSPAKYNVVAVSSAGTDTPGMLTAGVKAGDIFNYDFHLDEYGHIVNSSATIHEVTGQSGFTLVDDLGVAKALAKFTVTRALLPSAKAAALAATASGFGDHRCRVVFPDVYESSGVVLQGYYLAAALAGQRSGVVPHQPLTNATVISPTKIQRTLTELSDDDLDTLAAGGVWIVDQQLNGGPCFTRHQLTTGEVSGNLNLAEDSITTNVDSISYGLQTVILPYIGKYNINAGSLVLIQAAIEAQLRFRLINTWTATAGNQLIDYKIDSVIQDPLYKDHVIAQVTITVPAPMNNITLTLVI